MKQEEYRQNEKLWKPIVRSPRHFYNLKDERKLISQKYITFIGLWGRSMGFVTAILAAHNNYNFKVLVCDSPFSNLTLLLL